MMQINVSQKLGSCHIDVDVCSDSKGITALYGSSGAGKTSIINMVAGLSRPDKGCINLAGQCLFDSEKHINLPPEKRSIGYVFQEGRLFPHLSVYSNLVYGKKKCKNSAQPVDFEQVIDLLGIENILKRKPKTLSGGEKQRVALGRALLASPRLLLMDEPLASLDQARKTELLPFIKQLNQQFAIPVLYVSHSWDEIKFLADTVIKLDKGQVIFTGQP